MSKVFEDKKLPAMQRMAAQFLTQSHQSMVQVTIMAEANVTGLKKRLVDKNSVEALSLNGVLISTLAKTAAQHPHINSAWAEGMQRFFNEVNVGLAVADENGIISVPVIKQADKKSIQDIDKERAELAQKARLRKLKMEELTEGTLTLSNVGHYRSIRFSTPVIPVGQGTIVATCAMYAGCGCNQAEEPLWYLPISLSFDHRIINGVPASEFLQSFIDALEAY